MKSLPPGRTDEHNVAVTDMQSKDPCPQCRNATAVHSMSELAAMARNRPAQPNLGHLAGLQPGYTAPPPPPPANPNTAQPQPGYAAQPQPGYAAQPQPSWGAEPQPSWGAEPQPGWAAEPQVGHGSNQQSRSQSGRPIFDPTVLNQSLGEAVGEGIEGAVAGIALGAAAKFLGRSIGRRAQQAYNEKVVPALAQRQEAALREQDAIAERHPDLRACLTDQVFFLAGGGRVLPMPRAGMLTLQQSDALVTQLRQY
jgi:type IV secretory pathway VirB10-like protein